MAPPPSPPGRPPWRILSLDGGGVRGLAELLILQHIFKTMETIVAAELGPGPRRLYPCDFFDMMGGTSTGGLIALLLGRLRLSIPDAIAAFRSLSERMFPTGKRSWFSKHVAIASAKSVYDAGVFETELKRLLEQTTGSAETRMMADDSAHAACRVFVCAMRVHTTSSVLLRTYRIPDPGQANHSVKIWQAARATSATPPLFDPITIEDCGLTLLDGAFRLNNPINETVAEAYELDPARGYGCVLSIGAGVSEMQSLEQSLEHSRFLLNVAQACVRISLDGEEVAAKFVKGPTGRRIYEDGRYFRFNVAHKLHDVGVDQWDKHEAVQEYVETYLETMGDQLDKCARTLLITSGYPVREAGLAQLSDILTPAGRDPPGSIQEKDGREVLLPKQTPPYAPALADPESAAADISDTQTVSHLSLAVDNISLASFPNIYLPARDAVSPPGASGTPHGSSVSPASTSSPDPIAAALSSGSHHLAQKQFTLAFDQFKLALSLLKASPAPDPRLLAAANLGVADALVQAACAKQRNPAKAASHLRSAGQSVTRAVAHAQACSGGDGDVRMKQAELAFLVIAVVKAEVECLAAGGEGRIDAVQVGCLAEKVDVFINSLVAMAEQQEGEVVLMRKKAEAWRSRLMRKHGAMAELDGGGV